MKDKLISVIAQLERMGNDARQQQKLSRDPKKAFYWLGNSEVSAKAIALIKRTFNQELSAGVVDKNKTIS